MPQAACDVFCVGDDVNIEKANNSLISNDRSWKRNKFRLTYVAEAPELTQGTSYHLPGETSKTLGWGGETAVLTSERPLEKVGFVASVALAVHACVLSRFSRV